MSAVILFLSSRHPAGKHRTPNLSSRERVERELRISGEKRRKVGSKENKEERKKTERRKGREEGEEGDGRGVKRE